MSFETELNHLQDAVKRLEGGNLSLSESIAVYKEGMEASKACENALNKEKGELKLLKNDFTEVETELE